MKPGQRIGKALRAGGIWGMLPRKILKFYSCRGEFSNILKLQTLVNQINLKRLLTLRGRGTKPFVTGEDGTTKLVSVHTVVELKS